MRRLILGGALLLGALVLVLGAAACSPAATPTPIPPTAVPPTPIPPPPTATTAPTAAPAVPTVAPAVPTVAPAATKTTVAKPIAAGNDATGGELYRLACSSCHSADRQGTKFTRKGQTIEVPDLQWDGLQKTYSGDASRGTAEQQLVLAITKGQDEEGESLSEMMPRWTTLSSDQVNSLIQYLKTAGDESAPTTLSGPGTKLMGQELYELSCASCHGKNAEGNKLTVDDQTISVPALQWADLAKTYSTDSKRGTVEQQLVLAITKGQDEEGGDLNAMMPHWTVLSQDQVNSLIEYLKTIK